MPHLKDQKFLTEKAPGEKNWDSLEDKKHMLEPSGEVPVVVIQL